MYMELYIVCVILEAGKFLYCICYSEKCSEVSITRPVLS